MQNKIVIAMALIAVLATLFVSGCVPETPTEPAVDNVTEQTLIDECESACQATLAAGQNLSAGPCLLDPMSNPEWVCDIAHEPREAVDNLPENQCVAWHAGTATHFIEFTPECEFITAI